MACRSCLRHGRRQGWRDAAFNALEIDQCRCGTRARGFSQSSIREASMKRFVVGLLLLVVSIGAAWADPPYTRRSSQMQHDGLKQYYEIANFRLGGKYDLADPSKWENGGDGGVTLESLGGGKLRTAYIAIGTPRRNGAGEITNAIIINSYYSGDSTDMFEQWVKGTALSGNDPIIGPGRPIDTDRYYVVMVDPLGTWGASKPSDGLGIKFPQYSYFDMVQANYRMLRDHLKVAHAALATGVSMGGTQTYVWGVMHPEFVSALMPIGGTTQSDAQDPVGNWTFQLMTAAIESDPVWQATKGDYYSLPKEKHPLAGVAFGWSVLGLTGYDFAYRTTQSFASVQPEVFYWDPPNEKASLSVMNRSKLYDAVDLVWRNRVGETHNINADLWRIQARTMVMHITNDLWLNFKLAERAVDRIPGADLISEESPVAHYGVFSIINHRKNDPKFVSFMNDVDRLDKAQQYDDKNFRTPGVADNIDPKKSFWKEFVTYPYPVKYADVKDGTGTTWQIGYMDEYAGSKPDPQVLVVIHGKGAFGGMYGNVMQYALRSGFRVITPDLPHYGVSGPGNLDKSPARTMQDMRDVVHELVVNQLGVKRAAYLGHSLGGQLVMGYALTWPEAVQDLILEAPAGAPIFLTFGDKEPYIPATAFNGLEDLSRDVIMPFMRRMSVVGNRPVLKIYPNTGHFIHTDNPVEFSADVVNFITLGNVEQSPLAVDRLVNGTTTVGAAIAPTPAGAAPTAGLNK